MFSRNREFHCCLDRDRIRAGDPEFRAKRARTLPCGARRLRAMSYCTGRTAVCWWLGAADAVWHAGYAKTSRRIARPASEAGPTMNSLALCTRAEVTMARAPT